MYVMYLLFSSNLKISVLSETEPLLGAFFIAYVLQYWYLIPFEIDVIFPFRNLRVFWRFFSDCHSLGYCRRQLLVSYENVDFFIFRHFTFV